MDEVTPNLDRLVEKAKAISNAQSTLADLLNDNFVQAHTGFQTLQEMTNASGIQKPEEIKGQV